MHDPMSGFRIAKPDTYVDDHKVVVPAHQPTKVPPTSTTRFGVCLVCGTVFPGAQVPPGPGPDPEPGCPGGCTFQIQED